MVRLSFNLTRILLKPLYPSVGTLIGYIYCIYGIQNVRLNEVSCITSKCSYDKESYLTGNYRYNKLEIKHFTILIMYDSYTTYQLNCLCLLQIQKRLKIVILFNWSSTLKLSTYEINWDHNEYTDEIKDITRSTYLL